MKLNIKWKIDITTIDVRFLYWMKINDFIEIWKNKSCIKEKPISFLNIFFFSSYTNRHQSNCSFINTNHPVTFYLHSSYIFTIIGYTTLPFTPALLLFLHPLVIILDHQFGYFFHLYTYWLYQFILNSGKFFIHTLTSYTTFTIS